VSTPSSLAQVGHRHEGDHRCASYRGDGGRVRAGIDHFAAGVDSDEMLVYVPGGDHHDDDPLLAWLTANIPAERLTLAHISDIYPSHGRFDGPSTAATFRELAASARADGWSSLRAVADLTRLAADPDVVDDLLAYELLIDSTIEDDGLHGMCLYDRFAVPGRVAAIGATHPANEHSTLPSVWVRGDVVRLSGEVDMMGAPPIAQVLAAAPEDVGTVSLDGVSLLDAAGGRVLWEFAEERERRGTPVAFEGASRTVALTLSVYGLAA